MSQSSARLRDFAMQLEAARIRIKNSTYSVWQNCWRLNFRKEKDYYRIHNKRLRQRTEAEIIKWKILNFKRFRGIFPENIVSFPICRISTYSLAIHRLELCNLALRAPTIGNYNYLSFSTWRRITSKLSSAVWIDKNINSWARKRCQ
jgi:hypothetical protein